MGSEADWSRCRGRVPVRMPDGFEAAGRFIRVEPPHLVVFSWGFADDEAASRTKHEGGSRAARGHASRSTRVTVTLEDEDGGTRLMLRHENMPSDSLREGHDIAWNTYRPRLAARAAGGDPGADPHA